jgi:hypothetical protein
MVAAPVTDLFPQELDFRSSNGIEVSLLWSKRTNRLTVAVNDSARGDNFKLAVEAHNCLDAFHHPYAYAAARGVDYADYARAA